MFIDHQEVQFVKTHFPAGTRIRLLSMDDPAPIYPGQTGTVIRVDDMGHIHMEWDNGRTLALIYGQDAFQVINDQ